MIVDAILNWVLDLVPWYVWLGLGIAGLVVVYRLLGLKATLAAAVAVLGIVAYRKGRDDKGREVYAEVKDRQAKSKEMIDVEARDAVAAGDAAAERVRNEYARSAGRNDKGAG